MIETVSETGSTNADLIARLRGAEHVPEGFWLVADRQTGGRGRQGRNWLDAPGNFMGSTAIHLHPGSPLAATLSLVAGLAVYETLVSRIAIPQALQLKWPNDVMLDRAKLCGILLEREGDAAVIGIGINLAHAPEVEGRAVGSLVDGGPATDRDEIARALAAQMQIEVQRWREFGADPIIARWLAAAHPQGTPLVVHDAGGAQLAGTFDGLGGDGSLQLRLPDGATRAIHAGDVMLEEG